MFGFSTKEKAAKAAVEWLAPAVVCIKQQNLGAAVWHDPLVLGYLNIFVATVLNKFIPAGKSTPQEQWQACELVFEQINAKGAKRMVQQSIVLGFAKDDEFEAGMAAGENVIRALLGAPLPDTDPDVVLAKKMANEDPLGEGLATYNERLVGSIIMSALFSKIAEKFGVEWRVEGIR